MKRFLIWCAAFILCSCTSTHQTKVTEPMPPSFDKQGHRGCRGLLPENTIPSMLKAIDLGVTTLELDVVITRDKKVIVSHEPYFHHDITTKPDGSYVTEGVAKSLNIYTMTYEETRQFDVGMKPNPRFSQQQKIKAYKPLLSDLIDSVEAYISKAGKPPVRYNIEIKSNPNTDHVYHPAPAEFVDLVMQVINEKKLADRINIQSFDFRNLHYLNTQYPNIKTAVLIEGNDQRSLDEQLKALGFTPTTYSPHYLLITPSLIQACHNKGMKVIPWTVNNKADIERLIKMGVDGIITDYPNLFNELSGMKQNH